MIIFTSQAEIDNFYANYPNCADYNGGITVSGSNIVNLSGLNNINSIGGDFNVLYTNGLQTLAGMEGLTSVGGSVSIIEGYTLLSLSGLYNIDAGSIDNLTVYSNISLSSCAVLGICEYLASPNGKINMANNADGCNTLQEVEDACETVSITEKPEQQKLRLYPNPVSSSMTVEIFISPSQNTILTVSNTSSQQIIRQQLTESKTELDISHLPSGIYIVKLQTGKQVVVKKLVLN